MAGQVWLLRYSVQTTGVSRRCFPGGLIFHGMARALPHVPDILIEDTVQFRANAERIQFVTLDQTDHDWRAG